MVPFEGTAMLSDEFFHSSQAVVYDLVTQMPRLGFKNITGLVYVGSENMNISLGLVMACELDDNPLYETSFCTGVRQLVNMYEQSCRRWRVCVAVCVCLCVCVYVWLCVCAAV